jgi:hypothetical protein
MECALYWSGLGIAHHCKAMTGTALTNYRLSELHCDVRIMRDAVGEGVEKVRAIQHSVSMTGEEKKRKGRLVEGGFQRD